jgi:hypothetical protein
MAVLNPVMESNSPKMSSEKKHIILYYPVPVSSSAVSKMRSVYLNGKKWPSPSRTCSLQPGICSARFLPYSIGKAVLGAVEYVDPAGNLFQAEPPVDVVDCRIGRDSPASLPECFLLLFQKYIPECRVCCYLTV